MTKAQLEAALEAERCNSAARADTIVAMQRHIDALSAELSARDLAHDTTVVNDRTALLLRCKQLNLAGVPCVKQGDVVRHAKTRAVLARVVS